MMLIRLPREVGDGPAALGPRGGTDEGESADASGGPLIQIGLLGPFTLVTPSGRRIKRTATRALIAYLALHPHGATRDELLEALWPDSDPRRTGPRLAQSVSEARKHLGDALHRDHGRYTLDRDLVAIDADVLLAPAEADRTAPEAVDPTGLVRGLPLLDIDAIWADAHRARLVTLAQESLVRIGRADLASGDHRHALHTAERGLALEGLNEALWHILLRAHAALGARTAVTDSYQRLVSTLDRDLGVSPSHDTQMLYRELLAADPRGVPR